jgi:signal peptidase II
VTARRRLGVRIGALAGAVLALDLAGKAVLERELRLGESMMVFDGPVTFRIAHVRNPGAAFGLLSGASRAWRLPFFAVVLASAAWFLLRIVREEGHRPPVAHAVGLIAGGAAGNLVDRVRYGEVVDFLDVWIGTFHWPTFNVADSAITIGTGILLVALWRSGKS